MISLKDRYSCHVLTTTPVCKIYGSLLWLLLTESNNSRQFYFYPTIYCLCLCSRGTVSQSRRFEDKLVLSSNKNCSYNNIYINKRCCNWSKGSWFGLLSTSWQSKKVYDNLILQWVNWHFVLIIFTIQFSLQLIYRTMISKDQYCRKPHIIMFILSSG